MRGPAFGTRPRPARERAEEMRAHLEEYAEQLVARGLTPEAARREARLKFGNPRVKLEEVEAMGRSTVEPVWRDVRLAVRSLRHAPGFTAIVLAVLALGIGTATAILSVVDAVVLRGLPFREAHRLMDVSSTQLVDGSARPRRLAVPDVLDYRTHRMCRGRLEPQRPGMKLARATADLSRAAYGNSRIWSVQVEDVRRHSAASTSL